jgi:hypothetical protein
MEARDRGGLWCGAREKFAERFETDLEGLADGDLSVEPIFGADHFA